MHAQKTLVMVFVLSGCGSHTQPGDTVPASSAATKKPKLYSDYRNPAECEKAGGKWKAWCAPVTPSCVMPWSDGGKKCVDSSECESQTCMVDLTVWCKA